MLFEMLHDPGQRPAKRCAIVELNAKGGRPDRSALRRYDSGDTCVAYAQAQQAARFGGHPSKRQPSPAKFAA